MLVWVLGHLGGLSLSPKSTAPDGSANDTSQLFNWHPLLLTLAFPVLMAEAVLAYKAPLAPNKDRWGVQRKRGCTACCSSCCECRCTGTPAVHALAAAGSSGPSISDATVPPALPTACAPLQAPRQAVPPGAAHPGPRLHRAGCGGGLQIAHAEEAHPHGRPVSCWGDGSTVHRLLLLLCSSPFAWHRQLLRAHRLLHHVLLLLAAGTAVTVTWAWPRSACWASSTCWRVTATSFPS